MVRLEINIKMKLAQTHAWKVFKEHFVSIEVSLKQTMHVCLAVWSDCKRLSTGCCMWVVFYITITGDVYLLQSKSVSYIRLSEYSLDRLLSMVISYIFNIH
jgi:hypothetical protein